MSEAIVLPHQGGATRRRRHVAVIQSTVPQYRRPFFDGLRDQLDEHHISLELCHGEPLGDQLAKEDTVDLPWATRVDTRSVPILSRTLSWRACVRRLAPADLVIVPQKTSHLENYAFFARQLAHRQRLAFWGHGRNFQDASTLGEVVKRAMSTHVHWWFAYNDLTAEVVRGLGYPDDRITVVDNAIDTRQLQRWLEASSTEELDAQRATLGLTGSRIGAFVGGLYAEKRLPYLIQACDEIRERIADFEMLVLGGGPDRPLLDEAAESRPWLHVLGPRFDEEKVRLLQLADVLLMPGLVGLAVLDAFSLGLPLVTVADSQHSPEVDYLNDGVNGLMLAAGTSAREYGEAVAALLDDEPRRRRMADAGRADGSRYTIENMVDKFTAGILQALEASF